MKQISPMTGCGSTFQVRDASVLGYCINCHIEDVKSSIYSDLLLWSLITSWYMNPEQCIAVRASHTREFYAQRRGSARP